MSAGSPVWHNKSFHQRLRPFRSRAVTLTVGQAVLWAIGLTVVGLIAAMWLDIIWALPSSARWFITRPLIVGLAIATLGLIGWRCRQVTDERLARQIDQSARTGGEILAGLQLATRPIHPAGELTRGMAEFAATRAGQRVEGVLPSSVLIGDVVQRAGLFLIGTLAVVGCVALFLPGISQHQFNRFLFPTRDIPPYTGIFIELELETAKVLYGQDVMAQARVTGGSLERVTLVARKRDGQEATLPMLAVDDRQWQAVLTRVTEPLELFARSGNSRSKLLQLDVQLTPQILPPKVTITAPAYTRRAVYRGGLPEQGLVGLAATRIDWEVASNRPLAEGRLLLTFDDGSAQQIQLKPKPHAEIANAEQANVSSRADARFLPQPVGDDESRNVVFGSMTLEKPGRFELSVVDVDAIESQQPIEGSIKIVADMRPIVRIVQPLPMSLATPDIDLPVVVMAEDDYGISSLALYRSLNGSPASRVAVTTDGSPRMQTAWSLPLAKYRLTPGDEIQLFARTEDNDPSGPKGAESPVTVVKIISLAEFQQMMVQRRGAESMQAKYQTARRYFDQLASALRDVQDAAEQAEANPESVEAAQQLQDKLAAAEKIAKEAATALEQLSRQALPIDVDQELAQRLAEMAQQAQAMGEQLEGMQASEQADDRTLTEAQKRRLEQMLEQASGNQKRLTEQAIDPLQQMQRILPLVVDQQRFVQITQQQRDLANRLQSLQQASDNDPATQRRIAELETEQEQLKQSLGQLLDDIEQHAQDLPEDGELDQLRQTALDFVDAVRGSDATAEMSSAQQRLLGGEFPEAEKNAATAAEILESFLSQCNGMGDSACENCEAAFKPGAGGAQLGNSIEQMLAMMGMKPNSSGTRPGGSPGMGMGWGRGGGYAQRFPGAQNVGMYGSMPLPQSQPKSGRGDHAAGGVATNRSAEFAAGGLGESETTTEGSASGQRLDAIPSQYRSQVAEYYRMLTEELGALEGN